VLRGGAGIFWNPQFTVLYNGFVNSAPFSPQITRFGVRFNDPYQGTSNPFPQSFAPFDAPANSTFALPLGQFGAFSPGFKPSYMESFNFTIEREMMFGLLGRASYVGNMGRRLSYNYDPNYARYAPGATTGNIQQRRAYQDYGSILIADSGSNSSYNALQVSVERRLSAGFSFEANYTWSKAIDEFSEDTVPGQSSSIPIPFDRRAGRAVSDFDSTHRFVSSWVWMLPQLKDAPTAARAILGGWETGGIGTIRSGLPFSVRSGSDRSLSGVGSDFADIVGDPTIEGDRSKADEIARYFNPAAFALAAPGTFGNSPRNFLRGPSSINFDVSAVKNIPIHEQMRLQLRLEAFNVFNHANLSNPFATANTPARLGRIESAASPRIMQVALKFAF
jgi:hypothetical protein